MQVKSGKTTKKFLYMSHFWLHSFIGHLFCLVVLENNDGDRISLRSLFCFACDTYGIMRKNIKHLLMTL